MKNLKLLLLLFTVLLFSCGDDKKEKEVITVGEEGTLEQIEVEEDRSAEMDTTQMSDTLAMDKDVVEVMLTGNDQMKFNLSEIKVKAGQTVKLTLKHVGKLGKDVMGHNFVLLKQGTDLPSFAEQAVGAKSNDYIPEGTDKVIAHTKMIGGGEETSITFKAPPAGTYDFICSFPGHYIQMQGKFIVE
jgi:azurin